MDGEDIRDNQQNETASVEITEADFSDPIALKQAESKLADIFFSIENSSVNLVRPHISVVRAVLNVLVPLIVCVGIFCALYFPLNSYKLAIALSVSLGLLFLYIIIRMRAILIWAIKVYQATASEKVRMRCVYTPTCSNYAIEALQKLGVIRGVPKIISRLKRCTPPNGGYDPVVPDDDENQ